jgi:hypothetical protein
MMLLIMNLKTSPVLLHLLQDLACLQFVLFHHHLDWL